MIYIMQGVPGSGKTSWIKHQIRCKQTNSAIVCSADHYHTSPEGVYAYNPTKAAEAHSQCFRKYLEAVTHVLQDVYVDNTNTTVWELAPYYRLAEVVRGPLEVKIVRIICPFEVAVSRNTHNVPSSKLLAMNQRLMTERLPAHWNVELFYNKPLGGASFSK